MTLTDIEQQLYQLLGTRSLHIRLALDEARDRGHLFLAAKEHCRAAGIHFKRDWVRRFPVAYRTIAAWMQVARASRVQLSAPSTIDDLLQTLRRGRNAEKAEQRREAAARAAANTPSTTHDILCADSLDWLNCQPDDSVPFFVSDPPYGVGMAYDGWAEANNADEHWHWLKPFWDEMVRVVQPGGNILLWQAYRYLRHFWDWFPGCTIFAYSFVLRGLRMWEPVLFWTKPGKPLCRHYGTNDWLHGTQHKTRLPDHPCPKPLPDCRLVVKWYTLPGTLVVDPFCGSGTIPLACALEGRKWLGIDRSAQYATTARQRLHEALGALKQA